MSSNPTEPTLDREISVESISSVAERVLEGVSTVVVGMREPLKLALSAILGGGHVLFEDVPGLGKTLAARSLAQALGLEFSRLQCTPDLLPSDITGSNIFNPATRDFEVRKGPVFTGLFLADEINRTAPKTQSALLEAMAEGQVSIDGTTYKLPSPFHVIATSNPVEFEGTYALPEAQLDRFMVRLSVGYLPEEQEADILARRLDRRTEATHVDPVINAEELAAIQARTEAIHVDRDIISYCVAIAHATRVHSAVEVGVSPRGAQSLLLMARSYAVISGRSYVLPEDVKAVAVAALAHRITLTPNAWASGVGTSQLIADLLDVVPTPSVLGSAGTDAPAPALP
ncbi:AAA family ATPase [Timonella senegalensis]|uniref:AAA family ATPase n=1 Tax=Timonella senegalensis TaxID=1465825 RepID=UPI0028AC8E16|nr:MoxR family ATPase [Timonella senegalensis]